MKRDGVELEKGEVSQEVAGRWLEGGVLYAAGGHGHYFRNWISFFLLSNANIVMS